ncbi:MAG: NUDIX hydrolase [Bacillaceae bacterium]
MDAVIKTNVGVLNIRTAGILIKNNHVLLHKNVNDQFWALPGGRVAINEESKESVKREYKEELGIDVEVTRLLWIVENFFTYNNDDFHELGFYYLLKLENGESFFKEDSFYGLEGEHLIYKWFSVDELENVLVYPEFLKQGLNDLPVHTEQIIVRDR